jgi:hypothetical protein
MQQLSCCWKRGVSTWSVPRCYKQEAKSIVKHFCRGGCEERTWTRKAEGSPLSEVVARERLREREQAEKGLAVLWWFVEISGGAVIACITSRVCKWSINPFTNPNPVYSHSYTWQYHKSEIVSYLTTLFSIETKHWMAGRSWMMNLKGSGKKWSWPNRDTIPEFA